MTLVALGVVFVWATSGPLRPTPNPPGAFSFAVLGDAPYYAWEELKYRLVLRALDAHDLSFVVHVGDIFWRPCSDARYQRTLDQFNRMRHPVIYTPGDNEWTDCWQRAPGGYAPLERLQRLRQVFFTDPATSLGTRRLPLVRQSNSQPFAEFVENVRWSQAGIVFATVHLVGSRNGLEDFPARTTAHDEAVTRRTEAAAAWVRVAFSEATRTNATAVVIAFHANPGFELPADDRARQRYEPFLAALEEEVESFGRPVLVMQGNDHEYVVDRPLVRRTTGQRLEQFTRLQVPGSPDVGWVRVVVTPGAAMPFSFTAHVVPPWKFW